VHDVIDLGKRSEEKAKKQRLTKEDKEKLIEQYTAEMREASRKLEFEKAAFLRDKIKELKTTKQVKK
jgi:excinuclease ABC subunit B